jgi:hypothetical protein
MKERRGYFIYIEELDRRILRIGTYGFNLNQRMDVKEEDLFKSEQEASDYYYKEIGSQLYHAYVSVWSSDIDNQSHWFFRCEKSLFSSMKDVLKSA